MKKFELIKMAYDKYPKGTKFIGAFNKEFTSSGEFNFPEGLNTKENVNICSVPHGNVYLNGKWAEIVNPKIAVKVDLKQSKILCKHLGMKHDLGEFTGEIAIYLNRKHEINTGSDICWDFVPNVDKDYQIIPFAEFAEEKGIKLPYITSGDGKDLYDGDRYLPVYLHGDIWNLESKNFRPLSIDHTCVVSPDLCKAFLTMEAALSWIEAQKPKSKIIDLNHEYSLVANCSKNSVSIEYREGIGFPIVFTKEMIYLIVDTLKEFQK